MIRFEALLIVGLLAACDDEVRCDRNKLYVGMSKEEVVAVCKKPAVINDSSPSFSNTQWAYRPDGPYLYFSHETGKLVSWSWSEYP